MSNQSSPARVLSIRPGLASTGPRGTSGGRGASVVVGVGSVIDNQSEVTGSAVHAGQGASRPKVSQLNTGSSPERALIKEIWELALEERALARHDIGVGVVLFDGGRFVAYRQSERIGEFATESEAQGALEAA